MKKIVWGVLILALLLSLPNVVQRHQAEWGNNTYELIIPYHNIEELSFSEGSVSSILERLKKAGLQAVSIEPETLGSLSDKGDVTVLTTGEMQAVRLFNAEVAEDYVRQDKEGVYVYIGHESDITENIEAVYDSLKPEKVNIAGKEFLFIPEKKSKLTKTYIGYDEEVINEIRNGGLPVVFRLGNDKLDESNEVVLNELLEFSQSGTDKVLFLGNDVPGFEAGKPEKMAEVADQLKEKNLAVYGIEFSDQKGFSTMARKVDHEVIRLHSLNLNNQESLRTAKEVAIRAVKERNIRSIFLNLETGKPAEKVLANAEKVIIDIKNEMPSKFELGLAKPFQPISLAFFSQLFTLIAATVFISLAVHEISKKRILFYISLAGFGLISLVGLVTGKLLIYQGLALIISCITPIYAIIATALSGKKDKLFVTYLKAIVFNVLGIYLIVALLNGNAFLIKAEEFRGVTLTYLVPIASIFLYVIRKHIASILSSPMKYGHVIVITIVAAVGSYYLARSGNAGSVSEIELVIRQWLEETFYVRPRTKEFLIGFPFFVLGLHIWKKHKWGTYLLIPGVIGFLSMVNTFEHLHMPLYVSVLRSFYSVLLGLIIGYVFIFIYEQGVKVFNKYRNKREAI